MAKIRPPISFTGRDFESIQSELVNYAKVYYPETFRDFNEASFGAMMIDMVAYVGDMLSFYVDYQTNESLLDTAIEEDSVIRIAKQMGYKYQGIPQSTGLAAFYVTVPANTNGVGPNTALIPILKAGTTVSSDSGVVFTLNEDVDFKRSNTQIKVAKVDVNGTATNYALKAYGEVVSGEKGQETIDVEGFERFLRLGMDAKNVSDIIEIVDSDGNEYFQVDYLSQNVLFKAIRNIRDDYERVPYLLREMQVPRRFVLERDVENNTYLQFGFGSETEILNKSFPDPSSAVLESHGKEFFRDTSFDPNTILKTEKLGVVPANTTLTITYRKNNVDEVNVAVGAINRVIGSSVEFRDSSYSKAQALALISDFEVENEEAIVGSIAAPSVDEIKVRAMNAYASQNRAVTKQDYISLIYRMPARFGAVKRANIVQDPDSAKRNLNLYVLAEDADGNFAKASGTLKRNLKIWLNKYKMINDTIDILDGNIVNIGVEFEILGELEQDFNTVLNRALDAVGDYFSTKYKIGQPVYISDIYKILNDVDGVVDTASVKIIRKGGVGYSAVQFEVGGHTSKDGRVIFVPEDTVLEIKNLNSDITGVIK
mgnify:FL=1